MFRSQCLQVYKYRVRGEEGFSQSDVEEVFERRIRQEQEYLRGFSQQELAVSFLSGRGDGRHMVKDQMTMTCRLNSYIIIIDIYF